MYIGVVFFKNKAATDKKLLICWIVYLLVSAILIHFGYDSTYNGKTGFVGMAGFLNLIPGSMILPFFSSISIRKKK